MGGSPRGTRDRVRPRPVRRGLRAGDRSRAAPSLHALRAGGQPQSRRRPGRALRAGAGGAVPAVATGLDRAGGCLRRALTCTVIRRRRTGSTPRPDAGAGHGAVGLLGARLPLPFVATLDYVADATPEPTLPGLGLSLSHHA